MRLTQKQPGALEASIVGPLIDLLAATFPNQDVRLDSAIIPNSFKGIMPGAFLDSNESFIALADGGFDGEVVPIQPLLVKPRNVDVIIAIDAVSELHVFPGGNTQCYVEFKYARQFCQWDLSDRR